MEIDWSKAPEGATHYDELAEVFCNERGYWCADNNWRNDHRQKDWGTSRYIRRPASTWTGEGLPPAGTVCEANNGGDTEYFKCMVVGTHYKTGRPIIDTNSMGAVLTHAPACWKFRPIRTPEQIAAEEREKAVQQMAVIALDGDNELITKVWLKRLYDAGYRAP